MKTIFGLFFPLLLAPAWAQASDQGDVCNIRPDLCDTSKVRTQATRRARKPLPTTTTKSAATVAPKSRNLGPCRLAGKPYSLDKADLPVCPKPFVQGMDGVPTTNSTMRRPASVVGSAPAVETRRLDFETYLSANASHPALVHHSAAQKAFQEITKPVSFSLPNMDPDAAAAGASAQPQNSGGQPSTTVPTTSPSPQPNSTMGFDH